MPASLETNRQVVQELRERESALFFPVSIQPLQNVINPDGDDGYVDANKRWQIVTREDNGEVLAIHKDMYRLHKNEDVYPLFEDTLADSQLDLTGLRTTDEVSYGGGRSVRTYRFPQHRVDIGEGDPVDLMLKVQNSYDGSRRFGMNFGAYRILCSNGLVIGENMCEVKAKHTSSLDMVEVAEKLHNAVTVFNQTQAQWKEWQVTPVPDNVPENVVQSIPKISEKARDRILSRYSADIHATGRNLWTLYNAMTWWSTHDDIRESAAANSSAIVLAREDKVRHALRHPVFNIAA